MICSTHRKISSYRFDVYRELPNLIKLLANALHCLPLASAHDFGYNCWFLKKEEFFILGLSLLI